VVMVLNRTKSQRGVPKLLYCDNGSGSSSQAMDLWAHQNGVRVASSRPDKPTDNAFVESFNGTFRAECLDAHWFTNLTETRQIIETWRREYNESRPHRALGERAPMEFASQVAARRNLTERRKLTLKLVQKSRPNHRKTKDRCLGPPTKAAISPLLFSPKHFKSAGGIRCVFPIPLV